MVLTVLDFAATLVFALTGALTASRKEMDVVGHMWLAVATGVGGGTLRDLLIGAPVFWMDRPGIIGLCLAVAIVTHFTAHLLESRYRYILWFDAFGMGFVAIAGAAKGLNYEVGALIAVVMGVFTASAGGIIRDVLGQEPSIVLRREIYVTAAALGAGVYVTARLWGLEPTLAAGIGITLAVGARLVALATGWSMPVYRPRPGRTEEELEELDL